MPRHAAQDGSESFRTGHCHSLQSKRTVLTKAFFSNPTLMILTRQIQTSTNPTLLIAKRQSHVHNRSNDPGLDPHCEQEYNIHGRQEYSRTVD